MYSIGIMVCVVKLRTPPDYLSASCLWYIPPSVLLRPDYGLWRVCCVCVAWGVGVRVFCNVPLYTPIVAFVYVCAHYTPPGWYVVYVRVFRKRGAVRLRSALCEPDSVVVADHGMSWCCHARFGMCLRQLNELNFNLPYNLRNHSIK